MIVEITKEFFGSIKTKDIKCIDVIEKEFYRDTTYLINGVLVIERENFLTSRSYYIKDIND